MDGRVDLATAPLSTRFATVQTSHFTSRPVRCARMHYAALYSVLCINA